jgi:hypothetical protein
MLKNCKREELHKNEVMKKYVIDEMSKFKNLGDLEQFVNTLKTEQIDQLCKWLSSWRKNSVFNNILSGPNSWQMDKVHISDIKIKRVNDRVNPLLEKHDYMLENISQDEEICNHDEFRSQGNIKSKRFIAIKEGDKFKIIDGIHRAVRLGCDGTKEFELIYFEVER